MQVQRYVVVDGHPTQGSDAGWVYAWLADGLVRHVGATWLHPAARVEAHLHGDLPAARSPRLAESCGSTTPVVLAFPVPDGARRSEYRDALTAACVTQRLVSPDFEARGTGAGEHADPAWVAEALAAVRTECDRG